MREVRFKMTWREWLEGYRIGLSHLMLPYLLFWVSVPLTMMIGLLLILYSKGYPSAWPPAGLPPRPLLFSMAKLSSLVFVGPLVTHTVLIYLFPSTIVQISPRCLAWKLMGSVKRIKWKNVTDVIETAEYICFCQNFPTATIIPKHAFPNREQAQAFLEQSLHYWHDATGRTQPLPLDAAGIWPPVPRSGNSVEPGESR